MIAVNELEDLVAQVGEIPVIPKVAERVMDMINNPNTTAVQLQAVIDTDQAIASRLLKIANSAFYGYSGRINNTSHAVMVLGFKTLKSMVLAASIRGVYKRFGLTEELLWAHSLFTSIASRYVALEMKLPYVEDAFIAGLMHNLGMVIMNNEMPEKFSQAIQSFYNDNVPMVEAEKNVFGFTHKEVGALTVRKWRLSDFLEKVIYYQDRPEVFDEEDPYLFKLTSIIYLANSFCYKLSIGIGHKSSVELSPRSKEIASILGFSEEDIVALMDRIYELYSEEKGRMT